MTAENLADWLHDALLKTRIPGECYVGWYQSDRTVMVDGCIDLLAVAENLLQRIPGG